MRPISEKRGFRFCISRSYTFFGPSTQTPLSGSTNSPIKNCRTILKVNEAGSAILLSLLAATRAGTTISTFRGRRANARSPRQVAAAHRIETSGEVKALRH